MFTAISFTYYPFSENTYIVFDETKECAIIDPGCYTVNEKQQICNFIESYKLIPLRLINTHCHIDHVLGNGFFIDKYKIPLLLHENELPFLKSMPNYAKRHGYDIESIGSSYELINENDLIKLGNSEIKIILTPGHSQGSISLLLEDDNILISGDVLFRDRIGKIDLPGGDIETLVSSIKNKIFQLNDKVTIFPGHGSTTSIGYEKLNNKFLIWS